MNKNRFILFMLMLFILGACAKSNTLTVRTNNPNAKIYIKTRCKEILAKKLPYNKGTDEFYVGQGNKVCVPLTNMNFAERANGQIKIIIRIPDKDKETIVIQPNMSGNTFFRHIYAWTLGLIIWWEPLHYWWHIDNWSYEENPEVIFFQKNINKGAES